MGTNARITITTNTATWHFCRRYDGYPAGTVPGLVEFCNRSHKEGRPPANAKEAEEWLNVADRQANDRPNDPDEYWTEHTTHQEPDDQKTFYPITHIPAGDVSHAYHVDLRNRPED